MIKTYWKHYASTIRRAGLMSIATILSVAFLLCPALVRADLPPETVLTGTQVQASFASADDAVVGPYEIGFSFKYFGNTYTQFHISSNGYIGFNPVSMSSFSNPPIPTANTPNDIICAFFDDTYIYGSTKVFYLTVGTEPNRKLIVEYYNLGFFSTTLPLGTFQIILYEGSNKIQFQYRILIGTGRPQGSNATVGVENSDGTAGVQYSFNTADLTSEWVIAFLPDDPDNPTDYTAVDKESDPDNASYEGILLVTDADNPPASIPRLSCPGDGVTAGTGPLFQWGAADAAVDYTIKVDDNPAMGSLAINEAGLTDTEYDAADGTLTTATTYYWMIHAFNTIADETWSQKWSLIAETGATAPPGQTLLVEPDEGAAGLGLAVTFDWLGTCYADSYKPDRIHQQRHERPPGRSHRPVRHDLSADRSVRRDPLLLAGHRPRYRRRYRFGQANLHHFRRCSTGYLHPDRVQNRPRRRQGSPVIPPGSPAERTAPKSGTTVKRSFYGPLRRPARSSLAGPEIVPEPAVAP